MYTPQLIHNNINHIIMSTHESPQIDSPTSPQSPRVTFQTQSTPNTDTSANNTRTSSSETRDIELSPEEVSRTTSTSFSPTVFSRSLQARTPFSRRFGTVCLKTMRPGVRKSVLTFTFFGRTST